MPEKPVAIIYAHIHIYIYINTCIDLNFSPLALSRRQAVRTSCSFHLHCQKDFHFTWGRSARSLLKEVLGTPAYVFTALRTSAKERNVPPAKSQQFDKLLPFKTWQIRRKLQNLWNWKLHITVKDRSSRLCLASRSWVGRKRKKEGKQILPSLPSWWIPMSWMSTDSKDQRLPASSPKPNVNHPPAFLCFSIWRGKIIWIMTLPTPALQWLLVTGGGSCKYREALNKYLESPEACVLHAERITSSYGSFC